MPKTFFLFKIRSQPQHLLLFSALILCVFSLIDNQTSMDINLHDTYFVVAYSILCRMVSIMLFMLWVFYIVAGKLLPLISFRWLHIVITILVTILLIAKISVFVGLSGAPRRYYGFNEFQQQQIDSTIYLIAAFFVAQLLFIANFITGIVKAILSPAK